MLMVKAPKVEIAAKAEESAARKGRASAGKETAKPGEAAADGTKTGKRNGDAPSRAEPSPDAKGAATIPSNPAKKAKAPKDKVDFGHGQMSGGAGEQVLEDLDLPDTRIEVGKPFQIIQPTPDHQSMRVNIGNLQRLSAIRHKISLVSVVGPYHSGKSFLLNTMLGNMRAFSVGPKTSPETMGIWLCRTNMTSAVDGSEIWLMDSEGFFGPGIEEAYDAKIFTIATLLGSHLVYNTVKVIDQQAVNLLEMLARRAQLFKTKSGQVTTDDSAITPDFLMQMNFPSLTWIVEDFTQDPASTGENSLLEWLRSYLSHEKGSNLMGGGNETATVVPANHQQQNGDHYLSRLFKDIAVKTLFLPAVTKADLKDLSKLHYSQLTEEFRTELEQDVKPHILQRVKSKSFSAKREHMTGVELQKAIHFIVNALQNGVFPELPSLWASWTTQVAEHSLYDSERWFRSMVLETNFNSDADGLEQAPGGFSSSARTSTDSSPSSTGAAGAHRALPRQLDPVGVFNDRIQLARERAMRFYTELLRDFDVRPEVDLLNAKMDKIEKEAVSQYSARVHRHFRNRIDDVKEAYGSKFLHTTITLPHEPKQLEQKVRAESALQVKNFMAEWNKIAALKKHAKPLAVLPWTEKNPKTMLEGDLELLAVAKHSENEKVIQGIFQNAAQASLTACDSDLASREQHLFGKQAVKEFREQTRIDAEKLFENHLKAQPWFKFHSLFKTHEALVKQEVEVKLTRFEELNQQRVAVHLREVHDKALHYYKTRKQNLKMPMDEEALAEAHGRLKEESVDLLAKTVEELRDTLQFTETQANLERKIASEWGRMAGKNIELWKIHNDEVTQCGYQKNHIARLECGVICLHLIVPFLYRSVAHQHLMDCFRLKEDKISAKMGVGMQEKIFESWFHKELAYEANSVWNNFLMIFGTLGAMVFAVLWTSGGAVGIFSVFGWLFGLGGRSGKQQMGIELSSQQRGQLYGNPNLGQPAQAQGYDPILRPGTSINTGNHNQSGFGGAGMQQNNGFR
eukprot:g7992.t1